MKYPKVNNEKLDLISRNVFDEILKQTTISIKFDNQENQLGLSKKDMELLSWNVATRIVTES